MNQEKFNEDPFAMGSQTVEWLKSELASLRAYVEKMAERPRERVINFYSRSENVDESLRLSLSRIRSKLEAEELSETNEEPLGLDFSAKNLWNTILDEYGNDEACRDYQEWKEENDKYSFCCSSFQYGGRKHSLKTALHRKRCFSRNRLGQQERQFERVGRLNL